MKKEMLIKILPHVVAPILFLLVSYAYFSPLIEGKRIVQHDITMYKGSAKEILDFKNETGKETLWTNSMFGGMPAYLVSTSFNGNLLRFVNEILEIGQQPASFIFVTFLGFYILLLVLGVNPWLSIVGSFAYGFSSYFLIVIGAGHNAKIHAISYVAPMLAGMILTFKGKFFSGFSLFSLFFGLNLLTGHPQITYYAGFIMVAIFISYLYEAYQKKQLPLFSKSVVVLMIATVFAVGANFSRLWFTYDYGKQSIRGKSELTSDSKNKTSGLDKDYAMDWSYGGWESFNIMIPNLMGGSSSGGLSTDSKTYSFLKQNGFNDNQAEQYVSQLPTYWGPQPMTSGPVYIGAIVVFLFIFGLFVIRGPSKWAILIVTMLSIALAMGHNFISLSNFFLDHFPGYNKFRTVSMILYIAEVTMPLLAFMALKQVYDGFIDKKQFNFAFKWSLGIAGGISLIFLLFGGAIFSFSGRVDNQLISSGWPVQMLQAFRDDRKALLRADALRSLIFIILSAGVLYAFFIKKIKPGYFIASLGVLILVDMWEVDKRYMNNNNFVEERKVENPFTPTSADLQILKDKSLDYRVLNLTVSPFNDASTSYYHKSIGGYHGAKMRRYQEIIDFQLDKEIEYLISNLRTSTDFNQVQNVFANIPVFNMLNTKYFIVNPESSPLINMHALGNAWFVDSIQIAPNADAEIAALNNFNPARKAVIDKRFKQYLVGLSTSYDTTGTISLVNYKPNQLVYKSDAKSPKVAVFSEIYYPKGWIVTVDGKVQDHFRADYILRAMVVPAGSHEIIFTFKPKMYEVGKKIDFASSLLIILIFLGWIAFEIKKRIAE